MNLNIGCGQFPQPGWINTDTNPATAPHPDLYCRQLPFRPETFNRVYCGHVLEHIPWEQLRPVLEDLWRVLTPGGQICVVGPDIHRARAGGYPDDIVHACYGHPDNWDGTGEKHVWTCTEQAVADLLTGTFIDVTPVDIRDLPAHWPAVSRAWWQCAVLARKQG